MKTSNQKRCTTFSRRCSARRKVARSQESRKAKSANRPQHSTLDALQDFSGMAAEKAEALYNDGMKAYREYHQTKHLSSLKHCVFVWRRSVELTPHGHAAMALRYTTLALALQSRYNAVGASSDMEEAAVCRRAAANLSFGSYPYMPARLNSVLSSLHTSFVNLGSIEGLTEVIILQTQAVSLTPDGDPEKPRKLTGLGASLWSRFEWCGNTADLHEAIKHETRSLTLTPDNHPDRPHRLSGLGTSLWSRFRQLGNVADLEEAIRHQTHALSLTSDSDPRKASMLNNLGASFSSRFETLGNIADLEQSIAYKTEALDFTPNDHPHKATRLNNLGISLQSRFEQLGNLSDLEKALKHQTHALDLTSDGHPEKRRRLTCLGVSLQSRFDKLGDTKDLEKAILCQSQALRLTPSSDTEKPVRLGRLGDSLLSRFEHLGDLNDLETAIQYRSQAVALTADNHLHRPHRLSSLGISLRSRFKQLGNLTDIEDAIKYLTQAVALASDSDPNLPSLINNLGVCFSSRFERLGNLIDLQEAIAHETHALAITPHNHPDRATRLTNLGNTLHSRFRELGNFSDLEKAIKHQDDALHLTSENHIERCHRLTSLSISLWSSYEKTGNTKDLEKAILCQTQALSLTPRGDPEKPRRLSGLGASLLSRFEQAGNLNDLEAAIQYESEAVALITDDHPHSLKSRRLSSLGVSLWSRFQRLGNQADLAEAIKHQTHALALTPDNDSNKPALFNNLGTYFLSRFGELGNLTDLEQAIVHQTRALDFVPNNNPEKATRLSNLGISLQSRFEKLGNFSDLEEAIEHQKHALCLTSDYDPQKPGRLRDHSILLTLRFNWFKKHNSFSENPNTINDLQEAFKFAELSLKLTPGDDPQRSRRLILVSDLLCAHSNQLYNSLQAAQYLAEALQHRNSSPHYCLKAGLKYLGLLEYLSTEQHPMPLLQAHKSILDLLPQVARLGHDINRRYKELLEFGTVGNRAAADAIAASRYIIAIEWLESSRTVVWGQILLLRTPLHILGHEYPQLAAELEHATHQLTHKGVAQFPEIIGPTSTRQHTVSYSPVLQYEKLLGRIRELEGFKDFMQPKKFAQLADTQASGPLVIVNVHDSRCDALIVHHPGKVIHVPLPVFSFDCAKKLHRQLWDVLDKLRLRARVRDGSTEEHNTTEEDRGGNLPYQTRGAPSILRTILANLWTLVVKPILDAMPAADTGTSNKLPHITWCPTGPLVFLPIHAAGIYPPAGTPETVMDFAVSSYTPTLETLLRHRGREPSRTTPISSSSAPEPTPRREPKIFVVTQPDTRDYAPIPGTRTEAKSISDIFTQSTSVLEGEQGTVNAVLDGMRTHDWVHLACHGTQSTEDPTKSCFVLDDGKLTLAKLMETSLPNAELAVLSACQTATGDEKLTEEAVHLAAGMLTVGYKSVIATMWSIRDESAPVAMKKFYEVMAEQVAAGGQLEPAYALHEATKALREKYGADEFMHCLPYVHYGL